ncbi:MAG: PAS domain S-box protein [Hydrogenophaga sp.]|nr:PAS domain S-box protein [Hydrogenophaga sp.]
MELDLSFTDTGPAVPGSTDPFEHAPCGLLALDAQLHCVRANRTLLAWLGHEHASEDALAGVIEPADHGSLDQLRAHIDALRQTGEPQTLDLSLRKADGSVLHARLQSAAVLDTQGQFLHSSALVLPAPAPAPVVEGAPTPTEALLRSITDRIPARLAYYDKDLVCRFANAAHAGRYGKSPEQMVGSHLSEVVRPDVLHEILSRVAAALSGQPQNFEAERLDATGQRHYYEIHYLPDQQGDEVKGIFIELHDITDRRRTEELVLNANRDLEDRVRERTTELFESEQRYRLMVDALQDYCVYFIDENGRITEWTESAQRLHGHGKAQMTGQAFDTLMSTDNAGEDEIDTEQVLRLAKAHGQWETRGWRLREDGSRFWAHSVVTALRSEQGELRGLSCITRDMTAAKNLEDVMNDLNRELEKRVAERTRQLVAANKDLDVFSHMVSHDLRAPLRHISSFTSLLHEQLGESEDPMVQQCLQSISKSSKRMGQMIEGLLEYARLGRVAIESQPVPLGPLLHGVIAHLRQENTQREIEWVIDPDLPMVRGDAMLLAQAWGNLLDNAVKYTRKHPKARIELGCKVNPVGGHMFFISDNGAGFDMEKAHNLFVMFQRQHHSMDFEGNGTGLALTQRIIERHGGRIWCESAVGRGCTFYFTLPFEGAEPAMDFTPSAMAALSA